MSNPYFRFQQFLIKHDRCAHPVGTDGVLLGAWAELPSEGKILDVGCGSGLICLMAAQRAPGVGVLGVDIDEDSVIQAQRNVQASPFSSRISICLHDVRNLSCEWTFQAILCNPPFYTQDTFSPDVARSRARNTSHFPFQELISKASELLTEGGMFSVVIPAEKNAEFVAECLAHGLSLTRRCLVKTVERKAPKRVLLTFILGTCAETREELLVLQNADGSRSEAYQHLTRDFYL